MRLLPLLLVIALAGRLSAQNPVSTVGTIPDQTFRATLGSTPIDLRNYFADDGVSGNAVQFKTVAGTFYVQLNAAAAPKTVANFLDYVNSGSFTNTLIHRSVPGFIIQGGGFFSNTTGTTFTNYNTVATFAPIALESSDTLLNSPGTIAMARTSDPNSATSGWFINTADNSTGLPPASSGGYAAFGTVIGSGMNVVNALAALPVLNGSVTVTSSSTSSNVVAVDSSSLPASFGYGWGLLGSYVTSVAGNQVFLNANANVTSTTTTQRATSLFGSPFAELPVQNNLAPDQTSSVNLSNLVTVSSVKSVFPSQPGAPALANFSAVSSNPGLVTATIRGSSLSLSAAQNLSGTAQITVTATDANGNFASQTAFNVTVQRNVADFNGDGENDFLCQNNVGQITAWHMNGAGVRTSWAWISTGPLGDWRVVGKGDFNNDGHTDILCQNNAGQITVWYMDGAGVRTSWAWISTGPLGDWRVVGTGDFNNDGNTDILCQNNLGQITVWYMDGAGARSSWAWISTGALGDWRVMGTGDFNNDGNTDILCQNNLGQINVWYMDGAGFRTSWAWISTGPLGDWRVR